MPTESLGSLFGRRPVNKSDRLQRQEGRISFFRSSHPNTKDETVGRVRLVYSTDRPAILAFQGTSSHPFINYLYRNAEQVLEAIESAKRQALSAEANRAERRALRSSGHSLVVGDILLSSWGYDQTNIDYFQVVRVLPKSVYVREIMSESIPGTGSGMSQQVRPVKNGFKGPEKIARANGTRTTAGTTGPAGSNKIPATVNRGATDYADT